MGRRGKGEKPVDIQKSRLPSSIESEENGKKEFRWKCTRSMILVP
jgi:hypothetical protein